jgi:hypothetical protein
MTKKVLISGALAGVLLFLWGALAHTVIGVADQAFKPIPDEAAVLSALKLRMPEPGLYFFPWMDARGGEAEQAEWARKVANGPTGLVVYRPRLPEPMPPSTLALQLVADLVCGLIAAALLSTASGLAFGGRVGFVTALGLLAWTAIDVPYWNWYGYPARYIAGTLLKQVVGFALAGSFLAWRLGPRD